MYELVRLGEIADISTGFPFKGEKYSDEGIRVVRGENVTIGSLRWDTVKCWKEEFEQFDKYSLQEKDVVIGMDGSRVGKNRAQISKSDLPLLLAQRVACVRTNGKADQDFLYYLIRSTRFEEYVSRIQTGSSIPHISQQQIADFQVPYPPVEIQKSIATLLISLDSKISINNRINYVLEGMAKTIYDYWFVQFDFPISKEQAKAMGKPKLEGKPYKTSGGKIVWSEELNREVPEGWRVSTIGEVFQTSLGGTPSTKNEEFWQNGTHHWLNSGEVAEFPVITSELKVTDKGIQKSATELLPKGTTLISITRHLRPTILAIDACVNQSVVGIKEKEDIRCYFIYPYLKNEIPRLMSLRTGAQQPHINKEIVDASPIVLPEENSDTLKHYNTLVGSMYDKIFNNALENQKLSELRDWLLPMLMNGQVKLRSHAKPEKQTLSIKDSQTLYLARLVYNLAKRSSSKQSMLQGEMGIAKYAYKGDATFGIKSNFTFKADNWGPYDKEIHEILSQDYFVKEKIRDYEVYNLSPKGEQLLKESTEDFSSIDKAMDELTEIISKHKKGKSHQLELMASVAWAIKKLKTANIKKIYAEFKGWTVKNREGKNKAEIFKESEVKECVGLFISKGWDKTLIK